MKHLLYLWSPQILRTKYSRIEKSPLGHRLAKGVFWSVAGAIISRSMGLLSAIIVARMLGKTAYGELGIIQSTVGLFGTIAGFGLGLTATKHVAEFKLKDPKRAGGIIALSSIVSWITGGIMAMLLLVVGKPLAAHTLSAPHLGDLLHVGSFLLFFSAVNGAQNGALAGFEAFRRIARINLITGFLSFPLMVGGAYFWKVDGAVWGLVTCQALNCVINFLSVRREAQLACVPITYRTAKSECDILWKFSLPTVANGMMVGPVYWACNAMLVNSSNGYEQMGLYNAADQWFLVLLILPSLLGQVVLPVMSEKMGGQNFSDCKKILILYIKANSLIIAPLIILGSIASPWIMRIYGPDFHNGWPILIVVLLTAGLVAIQGVLNQTIIASGRMWLGMVMNLGWAACFILLTWVLMPWGALGLASARLGSHIVHTAWMLLAATHILKRA